MISTSMFWHMERRPCASIPETTWIFVKRGYTRRSKRARSFADSSLAARVIGCLVSSASRKYPRDVASFGEWTDAVPFPTSIY